MCYRTHSVAVVVVLTIAIQKSDLYTAARFEVRPVWMHGAMSVKTKPAATNSLFNANPANEITEDSANVRTLFSPGGIPIRFRTDLSEFSTTKNLATGEQLLLHLTHTRLQLLRGFDELLCLEGLTGVEHLPHQIETVRKVMRRFRGRVLLADKWVSVKPLKPACCFANTCCDD